MIINETIIQAVTPIVPICVPDNYEGEEQEYCTFNYNARGELFADDLPGAIVYDVQLHYFLPAGKDPRPKLKRLCRALTDADMTWPEITPAGDEDGQHYVLECEWSGGVPDAGNQL